MANVKPSLRTEKAAVTRRRIADAARKLFAERGYGATTLTAVAGEAGVAVQTVYAVYRSKAGILRELRQAIVNHREADEAYERAVAAGRSTEKLELFARSIRMRWDAGRDIVAVHEDAARADPSVRREVGRVMSIRRDGIRRLAATWGRSREHAFAVLDALTLPGIYAELVDVHGWTPDEYEAWLGEVLKVALEHS